MTVVEEERRPTEELQAEVEELLMIKEKRTDVTLSQLCERPHRSPVIQLSLHHHAFTLPSLAVPTSVVARSCWTANMDDTSPAGCEKERSAAAVSDL